MKYILSLEIYAYEDNPRAIAPEDERIPTRFVFWGEQSFSGDPKDAFDTANALALQAEPALTRFKQESK